jgi:RNA recognition motif-containing protein
VKVARSPIFIQNIAFDATYEQILDCAEKVGHVVDINMLECEHSHRNKPFSGCAVVIFEHKEDAQRAVEVHGRLKALLKPKTAQLFDELGDGCPHTSEYVLEALGCNHPRSTGNAEAITTMKELDSGPSSSS